MVLRFIRQVEVRRTQIFKTSFDVHYKVLGAEKNTALFLNQLSNQIVLDDEEFSIENISKFLQPEKYQIRDSNTKTIIGEITINDWGANPFWEDSPSSPNAQIIINKEVYNFRNITSWQALSFFSKNRFKIYDFKLYSIHGNKHLNFQIKLEIPVFRSINYFITTSLTVEIENNTSSNLLPIVGLFLIQQSFESEGKGYSG